MFSCSVVSDSLRPLGLQHARLPCPSLSPGVQTHVLGWEDPLEKEKATHSSILAWVTENQIRLSKFHLHVFTFRSIESVMPSNHLILCCPLLFLLSVFPSIRARQVPKDNLFNITLIHSPRPHGLKSQAHASSLDLPVGPVSGSPLPVSTFPLQAPG